jgi:SPP1 family predicted phage head-tail adaptor
MNPGRLVDYISISYPYSSSRDSYGQVIQHYTSQSYWAEVTRNNGSEAQAGGINYSKIATTFIIRNETSNASSSYDEAATVTYNGKTYNVTFWDYVPRSNSRYIKLVTEHQP